MNFIEFISWLFNINSRHTKESMKYEKSGIGMRIGVIIFLLVLIGSTIGLEYWCISLLKSNFGIGVVVLLFLSLPILAVTVEYCSLYSSIGFRMAILGTIESVAKKIDKKIEQNKIEKGEIDILEVAPDQTKKAKNYKWLDLIVGILSAIFAIGTIILVIVCAVAWI